jgi:hypothetical protein
MGGGPRLQQDGHGAGPPHLAYTDMYTAPGQGLLPLVYDYEWNYIAIKKGNQKTKTKTTKPNIKKNS